ncbi:MAG: ATPase, partial [Pseudomonadota bacterium]
FDRAPKPMCYQPQFLNAAWTEYLCENSVSEDKVDPNSFIRWTYARALAHRAPRYETMAKWGITLTADDVSQVSSAEAFTTLVATALERTA